MIDTIRVVPLLPAYYSLRKEILSNNVHEWTAKSEEFTLSRTGSKKSSTRVIHTPTGFRASFDTTLNWVEASLPRLNYGCNGYQLKNPLDLAIARCAFMERLRFLTQVTNEEMMKVRRLDLVLNLHCNPRILLSVHRGAGHPMIRRETELYHNHPPGKVRGQRQHEVDTLNTVRFQGACTTITLYDKVREVMARKNSDWPASIGCTRVEIQLRGAKHIAKVLGFSDCDYITLNQLNFKRCYAAYRDILLKFDQMASIPMFKPDLATCLAILEHYPDTWRTFGNLRPLDWYRTSKNVTDRQFMHIRNEVRKLRGPVTRFSWSNLLPHDRYPAMVDVDPEGKEILIPTSTPSNFV